MKKRDKKKIDKERLKSIAGTTTVSLICFLVPTYIIADISQNLGIVIASYLIIALIVIINIAVHEILGHALMGWFIKYKCYEIQILFLKISFLRENGKISLVSPKECVVGNCISVPAGNLSLARLFLIHIGGPVSNLFLCVALGMFAVRNGSFLAMIAFISNCLFLIYSILPGPQTDLSMAIRALRKDIRAVIAVRLMYTYYRRYRQTGKPG